MYSLATYMYTFQKDFIAQNFQGTCSRIKQISSVLFPNHTYQLYFGNSLNSSLFSDCINKSLLATLLFTTYKQ